jgi:diaminohydroxyphosphoribosylaminopyrimidine deaminase/5-amino-6-(5-phosphoribosylamino)uracil reductase
VASEDPSPAARGQGIRQLTDAGLVVETGLLAGESQALNAPYQKLILQRRPWVLAKWAMTLDGKLATRTGDSQWISNAASRRIVHQLRGRMDAILVGRGTVQRDDPRLTARPPGPRQAARVVLDSKAGLELHSRLVRTAREVPVIVAVGERAPLDRRSQLEQAGCEIMICQGDESRPSLANLLDQLGQRRLTNVMVEGGSQLLGAFFDARLIDEVHVFIATRLAGGAAALTPLGAVGIPKIADAVPLANLQVVELQDDVYIQGRTLWS